jgi:hypothetical protein
MSVGEELVKNGAAWWYQKYSSNSKLRELEREARYRKCGLWVEKNPMAPWDWRTQKKNRSKNKVDDGQGPKSEDVNIWRSKSGSSIARPQGVPPGLH